jgi:hypothetical protein
MEFMLNNPVRTAFGFFILLYIDFILIAGENNIKFKTHINDIFKYAFGFFLYKGNDFSIKGILGQICNIIAILMFVILYFVTDKELALAVFGLIEGLSLIIIAIISIFISK